MKRYLPKVTFKSEADLCSAFIAWAEKQGAKCYAEWAGWDILVVMASGEQIGVQAKLSLNDEVMLQALPSQHAHDEDPGPDFRAILVPHSADARGMIAHRIGLIRFEALPELIPMSARLRGEWTGEKTFQGNFCGSVAFVDRRNWVDWFPFKRLEVPETSTDSVAGSPSPITLTPWKRDALRLLAILEVEGRIHSKRIKDELGLAPSRWMQYRWLEMHGERGFWVRGEKCPPFDKQHPSAYAAALDQARKTVATPVCSSPEQPPA